MTHERSSSEVSKKDQKETAGGVHVTSLLLRLAPFGVGLIFYLCPVPAGLTSSAWHFFALFVAVIVGLITEPIPGPAVGFIGVTVAAVLTLVEDAPAASLRWALSGFSNSTVWLIFAATIFALGYEATGLGRRIALLLVRTLGRTTIGLGYAIALADLALAPFMPSNTARSGGIIFPVLKSIPALYGSTPSENNSNIGGYLCWIALATTCVTSAMFLTASAPNLLAMEFAGTIAGVEIAWTEWAIGFLPAGLFLFLATPLLIYFLYPPQIKRGEEVADWAKEELARMGALSSREATMAVLASAALAGWIFGAPWLSATTVALLAISLMILTRVVTWDDIMRSRQGWNVLVWFATLVTMADGLNRVGFLSWVAEHSTAILADLPMMPMVVALVTLYFMMHYLFASMTAHTTAVLPVFLAAILTVSGIPLKPVVLALAYSVGLMGVLTPYACGPAAIYYSSGYIATKAFWRIGFILGMIYLAVLLGIGLPFAMQVF